MNDFSYQSHYEPFESDRPLVQPLEVSSHDSIRRLAGRHATGQELTIASDRFGGAAINMRVGSANPGGSLNYRPCKTWRIGQSTLRCRRLAALGPHRGKVAATMHHDEREQAV